MALRVLCRDYPQRTLALATDNHALVLRYSPTTTESVSNVSYSNIISPRCIVEFSSIESLDLTEYRTLGRGLGTLGLITLRGDVFICIIVASSHVATVRPEETVQRIDNVEFYCLNCSDYDTELNYEFRTSQGFDIDDDGYGNGYEGRETKTDNPFVALKKLLDDGSFYYSADFNLTHRLQDRVDEAAAFDIENLDKDFLWNSHMIEPLLQFRSRLGDSEKHTLDSSKTLTSVIRGFVQSLTIPASSSLLERPNPNLPSTLTLISRLSSRRAGTRFNSRGIDDDGNVSNFVETETVLWIPSAGCFSYTQVRGSVPIFWEQAPGLIPGQQKIQVTRSMGATQPAFDKHFDRLSLDYGAVHIINLLSASKPGEVELTQNYNHHIRKSPLRHGPDLNSSSEHHLLQSTDFDFHAETRGPAGYESAILIRHQIEESADGFAYFLASDLPKQGNLPATFNNASKQTSVLLQQEGVFRTNCLDCLDRTNLVQTLISRLALESFLGQFKGNASPDFWMRHSTLWADNGDNLSKIYAGTGALKSSFTRHGKMSLAGAIADARKSATRLYVNNFADKSRQNTIELLLGSLTGQASVILYDPINDVVTSELNRRISEYSSTKTIRIWVGTFNLNGRSHGSRDDLSPWLLPQLESLTEDPDIVAVGFQEIVELSPQQIMSTDPGSRVIWEDAVRDTLNEHANRKGVSDYVLLRTGQLVGAALVIFVKAEVLGSIKNVEGSVKKTGLSGIAGNKGGCAIRLEYSNTRLCFVTAHLAAGFANYDERNRDYETISNGLRFQRNRSIDDHDAIIWLGDFNYRIGLSNDRVRKLIEMGDLGTLYQNDQLNLQMVAGLVFPYYSEGRINFLPTYKYDNGTDIYDTSEKARIPAWCDRILWKGSNLRQMEYNTAPLRFSDHRPVHATFTCEISVIDEQAKQSLSRELYERQRTAVAGAAASSVLMDTDDDDIIGYTSIAPGLPPASSDRRKWWLDHGLPARSTVSLPNGYSPNPQRIPNPFSSPKELDWIRIGDPAMVDSDGMNGSHDSLSTQKLSSPRSVETKLFKPPSMAAGNMVEEKNGVPSSSNRNLTTSKSESGKEDSKKRAPPVPAKPAAMSSRSTSADHQLTTLAHELPARERMTKELGEQNKPLLPGRQATSERNIRPVPPMSSERINGLLDLEAAPPLPPRRSDTERSTVSNSGFLDDDIEDNLSSWKPLQPGR
ncbi:hypothetical protein AJ80_08143 [Polytolypa hystricis UAMH7299]|uniref:phosphoinositide 5-phosphatase n=1 Tax=Polytolypa hystricis (strain UAMH7299) TaxID=1447883 RepID=A0A2B7X4L2_POLH7|nr:hypothetical protein AJ80_08143 [Polytolypa hystricis UAMH7299]